jgi:DNA-binding transcriptional ArsR family regulator
MLIGGLPRWLVLLGTCGFVLIVADRVQWRHPLRLRASVRIKTLHNYSSKQRCSCSIVGAMPKAAEIPRPLPAPLAEAIAERFRVLGEPMRIRLLDALRDGSATVQQLQRATGASQQNVSKHLAVLLRGGLVRRTKEGNFSVYEIADQGVFDLCELVCGGLRRQLEELDALLPGGDGR